MNSLYHLLAVIFGITASVLAVLAVLLYEGWIPLSFVDNITATEMGALAALSATGAVAAFVASERYD